MKAEVRPITLPLKKHGEYTTPLAGIIARVICVNRVHPTLPIVALIHSGAAERIVELDNDGRMPGGSQYLRDELTGFYLGDPEKPGAYWCETIGGTSKNPGWRWWDGKIWGMAWQTKNDCKTHKEGHRKSSRKYPLRWREEK